MKAFVLAACLLVTVYAVDYEELQCTYSALEECANKLPKCRNGPKDVRLRPDIWYCVMDKCGLLDEDGMLGKKKGLKYCKQVTVKVGLCKKIFSKCVDEVNQNSEFNDGKSITLALTECAIINGIITTLPKIK